MDVDVQRNMGENIDAVLVTEMMNEVSPPSALCVAVVPGPCAAVAVVVAGGGGLWHYLRVRNRRRGSSVAARAATQ